MWKDLLQQSLEYVTAKPWEEGRKKVKYHLSSESNGITVLMDKDGLSENKPKSIQTISEKTKIVQSASISYLKDPESCYFLQFFWDICKRKQSYCHPVSNAVKWLFKSCNLDLKV